MNTSSQNLWVLLGLMLTVGLVGNLLSEVIVNLSGKGLIEMTQMDTLDLGQRIWFRLGLMINHITMFLIPAILFGYIYHRYRYFDFLKLYNEPSWTLIALWGIAILFSYPLVGYLTILNDSIPLPDWASTGQSQAFAILENVLKMDNLVELFISLILVGVLPAIGEELIFRGIIQQRFMSSLQNPHLAILFSSILFGLTHMQLERILPLAFLGILLGYAYHYTQSIIVPIVLHFLNNSLQVVSLYSLENTDLSEISELPDISFYQVLLSIILTFVALYFAIMRSTEMNESRP